MDIEIMFFMLQLQPVLQSTLPFKDFEWCVFDIQSAVPTLVFHPFMHVVGAKCQN